MFRMSNEVYDFLKKLAMYYLPALATLIVSVFTIWGIPYGEAIGATVMAIDTFLGVCLGISTKKYNDENGEA